MSLAWKDQAAYGAVGVGKDLSGLQMFIVNRRIADGWTRL